MLTVDVAGEETFDSSLVSAEVTDLVKTGVGRLTVSSDLSSWKGRIAVSNGVYKATFPASLGDTTSGQGGAVEVSDGATLEISADDSVGDFTMPKKSFVIGGTGREGAGAVVYSGKGAYAHAALGNDITLRSDALVAAAGNFHVYWNYSKTSLHFCGKTLSLKAYPGRSFIFGYPQTPDPDGGRIVILNDVLSIMNPDAGIVGDGKVVVTNGAAFELSTVYGSFEWAVDVFPECSLRTKAKIAANAVTTNVNVIGGAVSLADAGTTVRFGYDSNPGGSVSFRGKVSGGGFSLTRDSRTLPQFHLFNAENDFTGGVSAAAGIDVYLWTDGALPSAGGPLSVAGVSDKTVGLYLPARDFYHLPSACFTDETTVKGGIGSWSGAVRKTGSGTLVYDSAVDGALLSVAGGTVRFSATNRVKIAGLYEGRYVYRKNTRPDYTDFFAGKNFPTNSIAAGTMCSYDGSYPLWEFPDIAGGDTRGVIAYKGYLWNNTSAPVTWAFAGSEAAIVHLEIGGVTVYEKQYNYGGTKYIGHGTATLQPGANSFLYVVYSGGLTGGPNSWFTDGSPAAQGNWKSNFGLAVNKAGVDSLLVADYEPLVDPGDGSVYTYALPDESDVFRPGVAELPSDRNGVLPTFDEMSFAAGTGLDFGGAGAYEVETLDGLPVISNCTALTVSSRWTVDVQDLQTGGSPRLTTDGSLILPSGLTLSVTNAASYLSVAVNRRYALATAAAGVDLGDVSVVSDKPEREFVLSVSADGKTLYLDCKPKGLVLFMR